MVMAMQSSLSTQSGNLLTVGHHASSD